MSSETTIEQFKLDKKERLTKQPNMIAIDTAEVFMNTAVKEKYFYNFEYMGIPIIQFPQDLMALQEIIWETKPNVIIETGLAFGGSHVFYANCLSILGRDDRLHDRRVISIEQKILPGVKERIINRYLHIPGVVPIFVEGSSTDKHILPIDKTKDRIMVCLDSAHWYEHVRAEIELYSNLVSIGCYLVVFDTFVNQRNPALYQDHSCQPGNDPWKAVENFTNYDDRYIIDREIDRKLLISSNYNGYLKRVK